MRIHSRKLRYLLLHLLCVGSLTLRRHAAHVPNIRIKLLLLGGLFIHLPQSGRVQIAYIEFTMLKVYNQILIMPACIAFALSAPAGWLVLRIQTYWCVIDSEISI